MLRTKKSVARGPKPAVPWEIQLTKLKDHVHEIFYEDGTVKEKDKHIKIWNKIAAKLSTKGSKISAHTLQNNVAQNRHKLLDDLLEERRKRLVLDPIVSQEIISEIDRSTPERSNNVEVLLRLQSDALLKPILREFCAIPFTQTFWPLDSIKLAKILKDEDQVFYIFGSLGNLTKEFSTPQEYNSQTINVNCLVAVVEDDFIPLCHIMTEENSKVSLKKFMLEIVRDGYPIPSKIVLDYHINDLRAAAEAFNTNFCYESYLVARYGYLADKIETALKCQIVVDPRKILQVVKFFWEYQVASSDIISDFYVDVVLLLHSTTSLSNFKKTLTKVLVLMINRYENEFTRRYFDELNEEFKSLPKEKYACLDKKEEDIFINSGGDKLDTKKCEDIIVFLKNIYQEARTFIAHGDDTARPNPFFSLTHADKLLKLCIEFVTWTNVSKEMKKSDDEKGEKKKNSDEQIENVDSNPGMQCSLSCLQDYKDAFFSFLSGATLPLEIDECIIKLISFTENKICSFFNVNSNIESIVLSPTRFEGNESYLAYVENWMGLNSDTDDEGEKDCISGSSEFENSANKTESEDDSKEASKHELINDNQLEGIRSQRTDKPKKRGKLLRPCRDFFLFKQLPKRVAKKRLVIRNANQYQKDLVINESSVAFVTTSCFDSLAEVFTSSYHLIDKFQLFLQNKSSGESFLSFIKEYAIQLDTKFIHQRRAEILVSVMHSTFRNKLYWEGTLAGLIETLIDPSIHLSKQCNSCGNESFEDVSVVRLEFADVEKNLANILDNTCHSLGSYQCCANRMTNVDVVIKNYFLIDVENPQKDEKAENINTIPLDLHIGSNSYALTGVICYIESLIEPFVRHYVAYTLKSPESESDTRTWAIFDDTKKKYQTEKKKVVSVKPAIIVYVEYDSVRAKGHDETDHFMSHGPVVYEENVETSNANARAGDSGNFVDTSYVNGNSAENSSLDLTCAENSGDIITSTPNKTSESTSATDIECLEVSSGNTAPMSRGTIKTKQKETSTPNKTSENTSTTANECLGVPSGNAVPISRVTVEQSEKKGIHILKMDLYNAKLPDKKKNKTKFSFKDIDRATLHLMKPLPTTQIISNASNQGKIRFTLDGIQSIIQYRNTCAIDSSMESLKNCYINNLAFQKDVGSMKVENESLEALSSYATTLEKEDYYRYRAKFLFVRVPTYIDRVHGPAKNCIMNVIQVFKEMMAGFGSIIMTGNCVCGQITQRDNITTSVNYIEFFKYGISKLGNILEQSLRQQRMQCLGNECHKIIKNTNIGLGTYIAFDMELIYETKYQDVLSKMVGKDLDNVQTHLSDIPVDIMLFDTQYSLSSVIEFEELYEIKSHDITEYNENAMDTEEGVEMDKTETFLHYKTYCRSNSNRWFKYDDLTCAAQELDPEDLPYMKISILLYTVVTP